MNAIIEDKTIKLNNTIIKLEDMDSKSIEAYYRAHINEFQGGCVIENEVFIKYAHLYKAIQDLTRKYKIKALSISKGANPVAVACFKDVMYNKKGNYIQDLISKLKSEMVIVATLGYCLIKVTNGKKEKWENKEFEGFFVSRSKADIKMIRVLEGHNILRMFDTFGANSVYHFFGRMKRIKIVLKSFLAANQELKSYEQYMRKVYGQNCAIDARNFYSVRILPTLLYKYCIEEIVKKIKTSFFFTADNLDRFALISEDIAKRTQLELICIPHGIEYGFILPKCFAGDKFYASSEYSASYLNELYQTSKFKFDPSIARKMFRVSEHEKQKKKIVFFTESREPHINIRIISGILPYFKKQGLKLKVKFHPADNMSNYQSIIHEIEEIKNLQEAVSNSICIARKSTILVEALYNDSYSIAILENNKDLMIFETFPALHDKRIKTTQSIDELLSELDTIVQTKTILLDA